ncbi:hypothetical protein F2Q69_00022115 [Brassica cretica]|uniref:Uncharacterized protein n=1 Tax=Brassica cretica TaxID=69181 RepID=A0A8S9Q7M6_BRACR|nr:hypothetical protein F2Q69_00022115 [Brassica cretica]
MQYRLMALQYGSGDELPNDGLSRWNTKTGLANGGCIMRDDMGIVLHWGYTQLDGGDCKVLMDQLQVVVNDMCILILTSNIKWLA